MLPSITDERVVPCPPSGTGEALIRGKWTLQIIIRVEDERHVLPETLVTETGMQPGQGRQSSLEKAGAKAADRAESSLRCQKLQSPSHKPQDKPNGSCSHNCLTSSCLTLRSASIPPASPGHMPGSAPGTFLVTCLPRTHPPP